VATAHVDLRIATANDAVTQLRPALHARSRSKSRCPDMSGCHENDLDPNEHLRVPL
jgi:hypothetical protein